MKTKINIQITGNFSSDHQTFANELSKVIQNTLKETPEWYDVNDMDLKSTKKDFNFDFTSRLV